MPMPNQLAAALAMGLALIATARADEGMWMMPSQLPELAKSFR